MILRGFGRAVFEAAQLALVLLLTSLWSPKDAFPEDLHWLIDLATAFLVALGIALLRFFAFPRAHLTLRWTKNGERELREVEVLLSSSTKESEPFTIDVQCERAWGLGRLALWWALRRGLWIRTRSPHAKLALIADMDRGEAGAPRVRARPGCEVQIKLLSPIAEVGDDWDEVVVRPRGHKPRPSKTTGLKHTALVEGSFGWFCAWFIRVDSKATKIIENWS